MRSKLEFKNEITQYEKSVSGLFFIKSDRFWFDVFLVVALSGVKVLKYLEENKSEFQEYFILLKIVLWLYIHG